MFFELWQKSRLETLAALTRGSVEPPKKRGGSKQMLKIYEAGVDLSTQKAKRHRSTLRSREAKRQLTSEQQRSNKQMERLLSQKAKFLGRADALRSMDRPWPVKEAGYWEQRAKEANTSAKNKDLEAKFK